MNDGDLDWRKYFTESPPGIDMSIVSPKSGVNKPEHSSQDYIAGVCDAVRIGLKMKVSDEPLIVWYDDGSLSFDCRTNTVWKEPTP